MSFIDEVRAKRMKLADVLSDEDYSGIRDIVEELYPDRAHFIYELLQNAEDAGATEASFSLEENSLGFEHNGQPFSEQDVWDITNIGKGTKRDQEDKIGRFGVGFKAVFAYSETPHIWSPTFSFKISELVLPTAINLGPDLGENTRFRFPFNNPKKPAHDAFAEIQAGLDELAETTLLFLSSLKAIRWQIGKKESGGVFRIQHSDNHIEVQKQIVDKTIASSHFLRFSDLVKGLEKGSVAIAFALDQLPGVTAYDARVPLAKQLKIILANPSRVAVFFPAEKEVSGLRFHLHAPFVPELSRASVKETPANEPLFAQLGTLAASSLHIIRDMNLLTVEFLGVLPNPQDTMPARYESIRTAIIEEMNNEPLTPTHSRTYAPASQLLQARATLKELLSAKDIEFLVDYNEIPPQWAVGATQKNSNADRFLSGLAITPWDVEEFIKVLVLNLSDGRRTLPVAPWVANGPDVGFLRWLATKPVEWHQQWYSLLYTDLPASGYQRRQSVERLKRLHIARISNGSHRMGNRCYFPSDGVENDQFLPRVSRGVYSSGKSKARQEEARKLLEEIGVREVGEAEHVQAILRQRYSAEAEIPDTKTYLKDLKRFIALVDKEPERATLFADFYIFERADGKWSTPGEAYVDSPILDTGLGAYYRLPGVRPDRAALSSSYQQGAAPMQTFLKFCERVGVQSRLEIQVVSCSGNPKRDLIWAAGGGWSESYGINRDYMIEGLQNLLGRKSEALSRLIWKTACDQKDNSWLLAQYRNNSNYSVRQSASQLVCALKDYAWIPQKGGRFVLPSRASRELLPKGFPFDEGYEWIKAIGFGEQNRQSVEENKRREATAKELGFADVESLERAKLFAALPQAEQEQILADFERRQHQELPEHEPRNPERRAEQVGLQAADAPGRIAEQRTRAVAVGRENVKQKAEQYLREQYTNGEGK